MNISGVLVQANPKHVEAIKVELDTYPGVEIHAVSPTGSLVVTVETDTTHALADTVGQFQHLPGVLSATMIYHHDEEAVANDSPPPLAPELSTNAAIDLTGETS